MLSTSEPSKGEGMLEIKGCYQCPNAEILPDRDLNDWFNDDDVKVYCRIARKNSTVACRPYNVKKETTPVPEWCPLLKEDA